MYRNQFFSFQTKMKNGLCELFKFFLYMYVLFTFLISVLWECYIKKIIKQKFVFANYCSSFLTRSLVVFCSVFFSFYKLLLTQSLLYNAYLQISEGPKNFIFSLFISGHMLQWFFEHKHCIEMENGYYFQFLTVLQIFKVPKNFIFACLSIVICFNDFLNLCVIFNQF